MKQVLININANKSTLHYVYKHFFYKDGCKNVFYVGKGVRDRYIEIGRNESWQKIVESNNGMYYAEIVEYFNTDKEARVAERKLQEEYWIKGQCRGCRDIAFTLEDNKNKRKAKMVKFDIPTIVYSGNIYHCCMLKSVKKRDKKHNFTFVKNSVEFAVYELPAKEYTFHSCPEERYEYFTHSSHPHRIISSISRQKSTRVPYSSDVNSFSMSEDELIEIIKFLK